MNIRQAEQRKRWTVSLTTERPQQQVTTERPQQQVTAERPQQQVTRERPQQKIKIVLRSLGAITARQRVLSALILYWLTRKGMRMITGHRNYGHSREQRW